MTIDDQRRGTQDPAGVGAGRRTTPERSTSRDLERYARLFSSRTRVMKSSAMRDMMAVIARPEVISLAGGLPDTSSFPAETLAAVTSEMAHRYSARALQYGPTEGLDEAKECIAQVMAADDMRCDPGDVVVTSGGQQVIDLVCKTLIDPGDVVMAEAPTYPGAVPVFSSYQADVLQIETDSDGMRIDLLEEALDRLERDGRRPKFVYTIPSFQNPSGVTMSLERRHRLVEVAHERELLVLEDNPYSLLRYEGSPVPTLHALDGGVFVMYLGTFSKILSPGIRLGWVVAPPPVLEKINVGKQAADLCTSTFSQLLVKAYFDHGDWRAYVRSLTEIYRDRRDAMLDALAEFFPPEAEWTRPAGGLFVWATLPDFIDTSDLLARALRHDVAFVPGEGAYLDGRGRSAMRLNFSAMPEEAIREGVRRIGKVVAEQVELYGTLTGRRAPATRPEPTPRPGLRAAEDAPPGGDPAAGEAAHAPQPEARSAVGGGRVVPLPRRR